MQVMMKHNISPFDLYFKKMTEESARKYDYAESHKKWKDSFLECDEDNNGKFLYSIQLVLVLSP